MPAFEGYNVFGAYADKECIPDTTVRVESKFFNHVRFRDDIYNPVLILNGRRLYDIELWTITYKYKQQEYAVIAFTQILPQDKCGIIKQIVGDNEIYSIDTTYEDLIKHSFLQRLFGKILITDACMMLGIELFILIMSLSILTSLTITTKNGLMLYFKMNRLVLYFKIDVLQERIKRILSIQFKS